jgi:HlyD family secretion protein
MGYRWLVNPIGALQTRYRTKLDQLEQDFEDKATGLPPAADWTKRLTQVILIGIVAGVGWSVLARVDVVVNSTGKLEPMSQSQAVQSKLGGTVTAVLVREGEAVKQGQLLMQLDKTALHNQMKALLMQREQLIKETAVLRMAHQGEPVENLAQGKITIPPELINRVQTRLLLVAQLTGDPSRLSAEQRQRFELFQKQLNDRQSINSLQGSNLQAQISEVEAQLAQTQFQLEVEQELMTKLEGLMKEGAIARTNYLQKVIDVNALQNQLSQNRSQKQQLQLNQEQNQVEGSRVVTATMQDLQQQLAELDASFDATIKENQRQIIQVTSQLNQVKLDLKNQDLRAPADGVVFNLGPKIPGAVAQAGQSLLQIVPSESLTARIQVANADIANIRVGMPVDVRIDAYPFTEYGAIEGVISKVGSEALKTSEQVPGPTVFPVEVRLEQQFLERKAERLALTPGMSLTAMIKVRQRAPITYVTEELFKAFDGMQTVR